jgi:hypothetical protein
MATLLLVDLGPPEHDSLQVMNAVFSSWPGLTDRPSAIWMLNISQMAAPLSGTACALLGMWW